MAKERSYDYFWNSDSDRYYDAESFADWLRPFFKNGVFNGQLQVTANDNMSVTVAAGYGYINGRHRHFLTPTTLDLEVASGTLDRIDSVILRQDTTQRKTYLLIAKGGNANSPVAPAPTREGAIYDLKLAEIYIAAGTVKITQSEITDTRMDSDVCGWVASTVKELDFSQITAQFDSFFSDYKANILTQYQAYLANIGDKEAAAAEKLQSMKDMTDALYAEYRTYLLNSYADFMQELNIKENNIDVKIEAVKTAIDNDFSDFTGYLTNASLEFSAYIESKKDDADTAYDAMTQTFNDYMTAQQTAFETWFNAMKGQLSTDAAGHLQNEIDNINDSLSDTDDDVARLNEVFQQNVLQNRAIINSLSYNQIAIIMELETLSQAMLAGTSDNVVIEMFDQAVTPIKGYYDTVNKRVYA